MKTIRGFTLIELLVVITIILILASIFLTVAVRVKFKANSLVAQSNAGQIAKGIEMYRGDHDGRCAPQVNGGTWTDRYSKLYDESHWSWRRDSISGDPYFYFWYWGKQYESYLGGDAAKKLFHDPICRESSPYLADGDRPNHAYVDWSFNGVGFDFTDEAGNSDTKGGMTGRADIHYIDPSETILFQSGYESMLDGNGDTPCFSFYFDSGALNPSDYKGGKARDNSEITLRELFRHKGKSVVIYADGHLEMNSVYDLKPYNYVPQQEGLKAWSTHKFSRGYIGGKERPPYDFSKAQID